jgi:sigma-B regulation protein RsbU (phosphoserine phosphatase)
VTEPDPALPPPSELSYDEAPCGYLSTTPSGTVVMVNSTFLRMTGFSREELVGRRTFAQLLTGGGRLYHETHYAPMLQMQGSAREIALEIRCADGAKLPVLVNARLVRDADGTAQVIQAAVFDATERRSYERELVLARRRAEESEARARELVRTLQKVLVPPAPPAIAGLDVAGAYRPARDGEEVGGDFYDVFQTGDDRWVVLIGDVCGKGVQAAIATALIRHSLRAALVGGTPAPAALARVNATMLERGVDRSCTVALLVLTRRAGGWDACVTCAGHPLPLLARRGSVEPVGQPGTLLGILPKPAFHEVAVRLDPLDQLVLYTDGVTEGRRGAEFFGTQRLVESVAGREGVEVGALAQGVVDDAVGYQGGVTRDDIAVVVVRAGS